MTYIKKTSVLIPSQLPRYIREDPSYEKFVWFLQAYYEWMEQQSGAVYESKRLPDYYDVDKTLDEFVSYFMAEFMPLFPEGTLTDKRKLLKVVRELYTAKGTPASYEFMFRVLFNTDVQLYMTRDEVLRASDGKWIQTEYMNLSTTNTDWLDAKNYKVFGLTSKGIAIIDSVSIGTSMTQLFLSGVIRPFISGEIVRVVDDFNRSPFETPLEASIIGEVATIKVDPMYVGLAYNEGDPVVFYGGIDNRLSNFGEANAYISEITKSQITATKINNDGHGYRIDPQYTNFTVNDSGSGAQFRINYLDGNTQDIYIPCTDVVGNTRAALLLSSGSYQFAKMPTANVNTKLSDAFSNTTIQTQGIGAITMVNGGQNYTSAAVVTAEGLYATSDSSVYAKLSSLGILAPINIVSGGHSYNIGDTITITGTYGRGARANVANVDANGAITSVQYIRNGDYPAGGLGYTMDHPPTISAANGANAVLTVTSIVGNDASITPITNAYGQVKTIKLTDPGTGYTSKPSASLRVCDVYVDNISEINIPISGDLLYQGSSYRANVSTVSLYTANSAHPLSAVYKVRTYNYSGVLDSNTSISFSRDGSDLGISANLASIANNIVMYGDGTAKAQLSFYNGIIRGKGFYLNKDGQPSGYSVLQDANHNDYTYRLQVEAALSQYKDSALKLLHPAGTKYITYNMLKDEQKFNTSSESDYNTIYELHDLVPAPIQSVVSPVASNTINFVVTANLANVLSSNDFIEIFPNNGSMSFTSRVVNVIEKVKDSQYDVTMTAHWIANVPNVVFATANTGTNTINIHDSGITNAWKIATGNTSTKFSDIIHIGDIVYFAGDNLRTVSGVDYPNNQITLTTTFSANQSGYLAVSSNTFSSNVYVSRDVPILDFSTVITESGRLIVTESDETLLLG